MSVNWYQGDGHYQYHLNPYRDHKMVESIKASSKIQNQTKVSSLLNQVEYLNSKSKKNQQDAAKHAIPARLIMSKPVITLFKGTLKKDAIEYVRKYHYHHFPVIDEEERIVGLLTDRDLLRDAPHNTHHLKTENEEPSECIASIMSTKLLIAHEETCARDIGFVMLQEKIKCVPIIDGDRHIKGLVTSSDLIRCMIEHPTINEIG